MKAFAMREIFLILTSYAILAGCWTDGTNATGPIVVAARDTPRIAAQTPTPLPIARQSLRDTSRVPSTMPCPANLNREEAQPLTQGPARLATIRCLDLPPRRDYRLAPVISPDGQSVAFWEAGQESPLDVVPFDGSPAFRLLNRVTFRDFGSGSPSDRQDSLVWRSDGAGLWSVQQEVMRPSGWALSALTPTFIDRGGRVRRLAPPTHPAGSLDALKWVGGDGHAIVQFGTRGGRYRPEHDDPSPTLAMVDVPRGRLLHTLSAADSEALRVRAESYNGFGLFDVSAVQLTDRRLRALLQLERIVDPSQRSKPTSQWSDNRFLPEIWLVWTQGQKPTQLTPVFDDRFARAELTPDGSHILAWRALQPKGMIMHDCRSCAPPPPPTPVDGAVAALIDTQSGRAVWTLQARAGEFWNRFGGPVISPTGKFALIPLPAANQRQMIGLLSMADGRVVQRFSLGCNGCYPQSFGFTRRGSQMWIGMMNRLAFYDLK